MVKHLAFIEEFKFSTMLHGRAPSAPWNAVDWDADIDWPWHSAAQDSPEDLYGLWHDAVIRSGSAVAQALADGGLGRRVVYVHDSSEEPPSLRRLMVDMIEE